jgi:acyl carrier protein
VGKPGFIVVPCPGRRGGPRAAPAIELARPLRYTGTAASSGPGPASRARKGLSSAAGRGLYNQHHSQGLPMSSTFDTVASIIAETCDISRDTIKPESHAINDLGIDSLDFLDIAFAIDKAFGIKLPIERWTQEVNDGKATTEQYFVLNNLCARIDDLVAARGA